MNDLSETEIHALNEVLDDECLPFAAFDQVIADFGEVSPLSISARPKGGLAVFSVRCLYATGCPSENSWSGKVEQVRPVGKQLAKQAPPRSPTAECMSGCFG